jgi:hypothetical protein
MIPTLLAASPTNMLTKAALSILPIFVLSDLQKQSKPTINVQFYLSKNNISLTHTTVTIFSKVGPWFRAHVTMPINNWDKQTWNTWHRSKLVNYQIPKAPVAKRAVQVPQWSSGEMMGYLNCEQTFTDWIGLQLLLGLVHIVGDKGVDFEGVRWRESWGAEKGGE